MEWIFRSDSAEFRALWDGSDEAFLVAHIQPSQRYLAAEGRAQIQIFGLYNTGTNILQSLLHAAFPQASICPDTHVHQGAKTCSHQSVSKHTNPTGIRSYLKQ